MADDDRIERVSDRLIDYSSMLPHNLRTVPYRDIGEFFNQENVLKMERANFLDVLEQDYYVPEYQRLYSWDKENVEEFWEAVSRVIETEYVFDEQNQQFVPAKPIADVFFGNLFLAEKNNHDRMEVIDGQQRITTGMLFLSLIRDKIEGIEIQENDALKHTREQSIRQINDIVLTSPDDQRERRGGIIYSNDANDRMFYALVKGDEAKIEWLKHLDSYDGRKTNETAGSIGKKLDVVDHLDDETRQKYVYHPDSNEKMLSAYVSYRDKIGQTIQGMDSEESIRALVNLKNFLLRSFTVGKVHIYPDSSPELRMGIFQAINDRGKELSNTDKIRARVANKFSETDYEDEYTDKWEKIVRKFGTDDSEIQKFLKVYLTAYEDDLKTMSMASDKMMEAFALRDRESYELEPCLKELEDAKELLDNLVDHVDDYLDIMDPESRELDLHEGRSEQFKRMITRLKSLGTRQWRPLVLRAYHDVDPDQEDNLIDLVDTIEKIFIRLTISDLAANNLEETFPEVSHNIDQNDLSNSSQELVEQAEEDASVLFGSSFQDILVESKGLRNNDGRLLLTKLAENEFSQNNEGSIVDQDLTISNADLEHILPSSLLRESGDCDEFIWLKNFFSEVEINQQRFEELERHQEDDPLYQEIEKLFVNDLANMILLKNRDNRSIGNKQFSLKMGKYYDDELFSQVPVNDFFTDANSDFPKERLDDLPGNENFWDSYWNVERFAKRRTDLIIRFLDLIQLKNNEFSLEEDDIREQNEEEIESRIERLKVEI